MQTRTLATIVIAIGYACGGRSDVLSGASDASADATACGPGAGSIVCNGSCTDVLSSHVNCGACGNVCAGGQVCSWGKCTETCASDLTDCGGDCVDTANNPHHCGSCTSDCGTAAACTSGACIDVCSVGQMLCPSGCVDPNSNHDDCGTCGHACPSDAVCTSGSCACSDASKVLCGGVCVDLMSDSSNCGACGSACGGTCTNARCLVVLATADRPNAIAIDSSNVYWSNGFQGDAGDLDSVLLDGGSPQVLVPGCVSIGLASYGGNLYFECIDSRPLARVPVDGGAVEYLSPQTANIVASVVVGGDYAYLGAFRVPLDGGPPVFLITDNQGGGGGYQTALDSQNVYWGDNSYNRIMSVAIDAGPAHVIASGIASPVDVAVDDTAIYWTTYGPNGALQKTAIGGGGLVITLASNLAYPWGLAVDDTNVYVVVQGAPSLIRVPKQGGAVTTLVSNQSGDNVVVDATSVYWSDYTNNRIMKLTPK